MILSSYEVVRRAIEFRDPDRLPLCFGASVTSDLYGRLESDVHQADWNFIGTGNRNQSQTLDEWGCLWVRSEQSNMGQIKGHPLSDWGALDSYQWLDPDDPAFYEGMEHRFAGSESKYVLSSIFMLLFERMQALRGMENVLTDLYLERERIEMLADRIVEIDLGIIQNIAGRFSDQIHGFTFTEDWGTQQALMINPQVWREFFKPRYIRIFDAIHEAGWHVWMHSCGRINAILGDLIEIGVNVINIDQPRDLGIEEIGQHFRGRICFLSQCDIQHTMPVKGAEEIRAEAHLLLDQWATSNGGFILSIDKSDAIDLGFSSKIPTMLEAFLGADPWRRF